MPESPADAELVQDFLAARRADARLRVVHKGELRKLLDTARQNAILTLEETLRGGAAVVRAEASLYELQRVLGLPGPPLRIEAFDISHFQGSETVASLVVLWNARPKRSDYRRFRIRSSQGNDDFRSMEEVVRRRAVRVCAGEAPKPDLFLIDGGRGQLEAALRSLREAGLGAVPAVGLAKRLEEVYLPGTADPLRLPRQSEALKVLQRVRDEAHRFAVSYHRKLRMARAHSSELRNLPGVGPGRERSLLLHFGSLESLRQAAVSDIAQVPGVGPRLASKIHQALHAGEEAGKQTA